MVKTAGSSSYSTATRPAASSAASSVSAATAATGSPWYFVSPTARTGPVLELRAEARHGLGQVGRRQDEADAGTRERRARVDAR